MERRSLKRKVTDADVALSDLPAENTSSNDNSSKSVLKPLLPSEIPEFLHDSEFYESLNLEENDPIFIPEDVANFSSELEEARDVRSLLETLRFWGARRIPKFLLEYVLTHKQSDFAVACGDHSMDLPFLHELSKIRSKPSNVYLNYAMRSAHVEIVEYMHSALNLPWTSSALHEAARFGRIDNLRYAKDHGGIFDSSLCIVASSSGPKVLLYMLQQCGACDEDTDSICTAAATYGDLDCLKLARQRGWPWSSRTTAVAADLPTLQNLHQEGCPWDQSCCTTAAYHGRLDCLIYAHENGCEWGNSTCDVAAMNGKLNCLQYAHEQGCEWSINTMANAAKTGQLACLTYLQEHGCPWSAHSIKLALLGKHIACVKYAVVNNCPCYAENTIQAALISGRLSWLRYAHTHGCQWNIKSCALAAHHGHLECLRFLHDNGCPWNKTTTSEALVGRHEHCLRYAVQNGCPFAVPTTCGMVAFRGQLDLLKFLHEQSGSWSSEIASHVAECAAAAGSLNCLKYASEQGCGRLHRICAEAACGGHLECLQYIRGLGWPWISTACSLAAAGGFLNCLKFLHQNGCPWDADACRAAAANGHIECLKYAHKGGCSIKRSAYVIALSNGHAECVQYILDQGAVV